MVAGIALDAVKSKLDLLQDKDIEEVKLEEIKETLTPAILVAKIEERKE